MLKFTIITNTIRRPLDLVLKSVKASLSQNESVSVILIDQNQHGLKFPGEISSNPRFKHLHCQVPAVSMARNRADYAVDTDWLVFCDDDGYLAEGYITQLIGLIEKFPEVEIFAGGIKRIDNGEYYSKRHAVGGDMKWFWNTKLLMGSNFVIKKSTFEDLGKFDEKFGAGALYGSSEETDLAWNAFFHQNRMRYSPELVVYHVPPHGSDVKTEIRKAFNYGIGKSALVRKWFFLGHIIVLYEAAEMLVLPLLRAFLSLVLFRCRNALIQFSILFGRMAGLLIVRK